MHNVFTNVFTIVGDPHATHKSLDSLSKLCEQVEELGNPVVWLGDMLDTKEVIRGKCLTFWLEYFNTSRLRHFVLVGNHDWFNLECQDHSLEALKYIPNVTVVDKPTHCSPMTQFIPYIHDQKELKKVLKNIPDGATIFAHLELKGFDFGNGYICESGLTAASFKRFKKVISGHFHKYQEKGNLVYLGTPFSHSFGESNQTKYIGIYDLALDTLELIETDLPRHLTVEFDCDYSFEQSGDEMHHAFTFDMRPEDYHRVILTGTQENIDRFSTDMYTKNPDCKLNIKFLKRPSDTQMNAVNLDETQTNEMQFSNWAADIKKLDPETTKLGLDILGAVSGK